MDPSFKRLTEDEFGKFAKLIHEESGILLKSTKLTLLSNRLRKRLNALEIAEFSDYYGYLQKLPPKEKMLEYEKMLDVVSTNETYFFRIERHFDALTKVCLPEISKNKKNRRLTIWSAACSSGEEPYTIAICVMENRHLFAGWDIKIIATDIAPSVLEFAKIGEYSGRRIEKIPSELLKKYFTQKDGDPPVYTINDELKKLVRFSYHNFFKSPFPKDIDILFCRNVMIYFDKKHQIELIRKFYDSILDGGYLFIGHSETLHDISSDFIYSKIMEAPVYVPIPRRHA